MESRIELFVEDIVNLYRSLNIRNGVCDTIEFGEAWNKNGTEYLHYYGSSTAIPFHVPVIESLFRIAVAYLSISREVSKNASTFGLHLCYFLYFTQPAKKTPQPVRIAIPYDVLSDLVSVKLEAHLQVQNPEQETQNYNSESGISNVSVGEGKQNCPTSSPSQNLDADGILLLALHEAGAWDVQPYMNSNACVHAIFTTHERLRAPLVGVQLHTSRARTSFSQGNINNNSGGGGSRTSLHVSPSMSTISTEEVRDYEEKVMKYLR